MRPLILAVLLACAGAAHAEFRTGNRLLSEMNDSTYFAQGMAMGYVIGVADANNGTNHCLPATATVGQLHDMVKNMLIETPAVRHLPADTIVNYVLNKAWPCAKKGQAL